MRKTYPQLSDKQWLQEQINMKSIHKIAREIGCSYSGVMYATERLGVVRNPNIEYRELSTKGNEHTEHISARKDEIINNYTGFIKTIPDMAIELGVSYATLRGLIKSWGIDTKPRAVVKKRSKLIESKDEVIARYNNGESIRSMYAQYDVSYKTMRDTLMKWGTHSSRNAPQYPMLADKVLLRSSYLDRKLSVQQIADESGASRGAVYSALVWANIPLRSIEEGLDLKFNGPRTGERGTNWRGGRAKAGKGYVMLVAEGHPYATKDGYVMEHRLVMEKELGRYLMPNEIVHHKNGDRQLNTPENLVVTTRKEHFQEHFDAVKKVDSLEEQIAKYKAKFGDLPLDTD